jgi:hypothetical protein
VSPRTLVAADHVVNHLVEELAEQFSTGESSSEWKPGRNDDLEWSRYAEFRRTD